nr:hypothetical protein [Actinoplanes brasiliensis]
MFVSIRPRVASPVAVERVLLGGGVEVGTQPLGIDCRGGGKGGHHLFAVNVGTPPEWDETTDRCSVARDRARLAALDRAQDGAGIVSKLALCDLG